jgi:hypothetical protein
MRRLIYIPLLIVLAVSCTETKLLEGIWTTEEEMTSVDPGVLPNKVYMRFVLGHYGPDVTGLVHFSEDLNGSFENVYCPCRYIERGKFKDGRFTFKIESCISDGTFITGEFNIDDVEETLTGFFTYDGEQVSSEVVFVLTGSIKDMVTGDKRCPADD